MARGMVIKALRTDERFHEAVEQVLAYYEREECKRGIEETPEHTYIRLLYRFGMTIRETAARIGVSPRMLQRDIAPFADVVLHARLRRQAPDLAEILGNPMPAHERTV